MRIANRVSVPLPDARFGPTENLVSEAQDGKQRDPDRWRKQAQVARRPNVAVTEAKKLQAAKP